MTMKNAKFETNVLGTKQVLKGPGSVIPVENEITDDILYFRELACEKSISSNFNETRMFYRAYLFSCISLLDAFIQKCTIILENNINESDLELLKSKNVNLSDKLEKLFEIYTGEDVQLLKSVVQWKEYMKLKELRNGITHPANPYNIYEISKLPEYLNYVREGIGGLLELFFFYAREESLISVKKLKYAKQVEYNER